MIYNTKEKEKEKLDKKKEINKANKNEEINLSKIEKDKKEQKEIFKKRILKKNFEILFTYLFFIFTFLIYISNNGIIGTTKVVIDPSLGISTVLNAFIFAIPILIYINSKTINENMGDFKSYFAITYIAITICMIYELVFMRDIFNLKKYIVSYIVALIYVFILNFVQKMFKKYVRLKKEEKENVKLKKIKNEKAKKEQNIFLKYKKESILIFSILALFVYNLIFHIIFRFPINLKVNVVYIKLMASLINIIDIILLILPIVFIYLILNVSLRSIDKNE